MTSSLRVAAVGLMVFNLSGLVLCPAVGRCGELTEKPSEDLKLLRAIQEAWDTRARQFTTGRIEFEVWTTYAKGAPAGPLGPALQNEHATSARGTFVFRDNQARYELAGEEWSHVARRFTAQRRVYVYDGRTTRAFFEDEAAADRSFGFQNVSYGSLQGGGWNYETDALTMAFRPSSKAFDGITNLLAWHVVERDVIAGGERMHHLEFKGYHLWVSAAPEFRVVKRELWSQGFPMLQMTVDYTPDAQFGPLVSSWTVIRRGWS